jgi:hypothetical protein
MVLGLLNNSMYGLELCPKCKKGHLYPVVTASASGEPKGQFRETGSIRDYQCAICGYKRKAAAKQKQNVDVKDKVSARVHKTKKAKNTTKTRAKTKAKRKRTKLK